MIATDATIAVPLSPAQAVAQARAARRASRLLRGRSDEVRQASRWACTRATFTLARSAHSAELVLESTTRWPRADRPLRVALPAQLESVPLARHSLARWLAGNGAGADAIFALSVALGEACTNAVEHAQRARPQAVLVRAERKGRSVRVVVRDYGRWDYPRPSTSAVAASS